MSDPTALQPLRDAGDHAGAAGDLAGRLVRALTRPRPQRRDQSRGYADTALLNALAEEGCPICRTTADHDQRYFFWFLHGSYAQIEVIERLTRSLGFCLVHGAALLTRSDAASQLAFVHEAIAQHLTRRTATDKGQQSWTQAMLSVEHAVARCPACRSAEEAAGRSAFLPQSHQLRGDLCPPTGEFRSLKLSTGRGALQIMIPKNIAKSSQRSTFQRICASGIETSLIAVIKA